MPAGGWANMPVGAWANMPVGAWANIPLGEAEPAGGATPPRACPEGGC